MKCDECDSEMSGDIDACDSCGTPFCACTTKPGQPLTPCHYHNGR